MIKLCRKYWAVSGVFITVLAVCLLFCTRKAGMFIDEVYTYGLSNSYYAPYIADIKGGDISSTEFTRQDILEYLTVGNEDRFAFGSVYSNQEADVHPPLYYWVFNLVSSCFPGSYSKWTGLGINLFFYMAALAVLFRLCLLLYSSEDTGAATVVLYGTSVLGTSAVMLIRMYTLLMFFTVLAAYAAARILSEPERKKRYAAFAGVITAGMLTQYYFSLYACFLTIACAAYFLNKGNRKACLKFCLYALAGVAAAFIIFPAGLKHIFIGNGQAVGGAGVTAALKDTGSYAERIKTFLSFGGRFKGIKWALLGVLAVSVAVIPGVAKAIDEKEVSYRAFIIVIPALLALLTAAIVSPVQQMRYIYNLMPIIALGAGFVFYLFEAGLGEAPKSGAIKKAMVLAAAVIAVWAAKTLPPDNLFPEQAEYDAIIRANAAKKCVYLDNGYSAPLTQDALQLMQFDNFFVTNDLYSKELIDYLGDADEAVFYVDNNARWSSGYKRAEAVEQFGRATGMSNAEELYSQNYSGEGGLSVVYLMKKP